MNLPPAGSPLRKVLLALRNKGLVTIEEGLALHGHIYSRANLSGVRTAYNAWADGGWLVRIGDKYKLSLEAKGLIDGAVETPGAKLTIVPPRTAFAFRELSASIPSRDYNAIRPGSADLLPDNHGVYRRA